MISPKQDLNCWKTSTMISRGYGFSGQPDNKIWKRRKLLVKWTRRCLMMDGQNTKVWWGRYTGSTAKVEEPMYGAYALKFVKRLKKSCYMTRNRDIIMWKSAYWRRYVEVIWYSVNKHLVFVNSKTHLRFAIIWPIIL